MNTNREKQTIQYNSSIGTSINSNPNTNTTTNSISNVNTTNDKMKNNIDERNEKSKINESVNVRSPLGKKIVNLDQDQMNSFLKGKGSWATEEESQEQAYNHEESQNIPTISNIPFSLSNVDNSESVNSGTALNIPPPSASISSPSSSFATGGAILSFKTRSPSSLMMNFPSSSPSSHSFEESTIYVKLVAGMSVIKIKYQKPICKTIFTRPSSLENQSIPHFHTPSNSHSSSFSSRDQQRHQETFNNEREDHEINRLSEENVAKPSVSSPSHFYSFASMKSQRLRDQIDERGGNYKNAQEEIKKYNLPSMNQYQKQKYQKSRNDFNSNNRKKIEKGKEKEESGINWNISESSSSNSNDNKTLMIEKIDNDSQKTRIDFVSTGNSSAISINASNDKIDNDNQGKNSLDWKAAEFIPNKQENGKINKSDNEISSVNVKDVVNGGNNNKHQNLKSKKDPINYIAQARPVQNA